MRAVLLLSVIVALAALLGVGCALLSGDYACVDDPNCPSDRVCVAGVCAPGEGQGEGGEGEGGEGEGGEGEGEEGEGEGEGEGCETVTADFTINNPGNLNAIRNALEGFVCVTLEGSLSIRANFSDFPELRNIAAITGTLTVDNTGGEFRALDDLPILASIGGDLRIGRSELVDVSLPALVTIGGSVDVDDNNQLETLALDALDEVGGDFRVTNNAALPCDQAEAIVDGLATFDGTAEISGNLDCP